MNKWNEEKVAELEGLLSSGYTLQQCAVHFSVTKACIGSVRKKYLPDLDRTKFGQALRPKILKVKKNSQRVSWKGLDRMQLAHHIAFIRKRSSAKRAGVVFKIKTEDIDWPTHCPVLGIELDWFATVRQENSPSFDRLDSSQGYIPGNVVVMSWRANRIKNDSTPEELLAIALWYGKQKTLDIQVS